MVGQAPSPLPPLWSAEVTVEHRCGRAIVLKSKNVSHSGCFLIPTQKTPRLAALSLAFREELLWPPSMKVWEGICFRGCFRVQYHSQQNGREIRRTHSENQLS